MALVGALLDQQFTVYAINLKAADWHRERFRVAGAKPDLRDHDARPDSPILGVTGASTARPPRSWSLDCKRYSLA
jgi:hypothetical protein